MQIDMLQQIQLSFIHIIYFTQKIIECVGGECLTWSERKPRWSLVSNSQNLIGINI